MRTRFSLLVLLLAALPIRAGERHYLYVVAPGVRNYLELGGAGVLVFDMDAGHKLVKRIDTPAARQPKPENIKGVCACAATKRLYFTTLTKLYCLDLVTEKTLWEKALPGGCDRMAITPDGRLLYVPSLEGPHWNVVDSATGDLLTQIKPDSGSHNTVCSLDGKRAYLAGLKSPLLTVVDTATQQVVGQAGPFGAAIRPFTVNAARTRCYVNVNGLLGFEIGDLTTGKKLHRVEVQGFQQGLVKRHGCPSHGVGLTPDEKEIWLCDAANSRLHVFDNTTAPPKQTAAIALRDQPGWVTFSLDGRYAYPSTGEIVDTKTKRILSALQDEKGREVHSEKMVEVVFQDGVPVRTGDQFGVGRAAEQAQGGREQTVSGKQWVYVGTYTSGQSKGIYLLELDLATGALTPRGLAGEVTNPSFLALHPSKKFLYAVGETGDFKGLKSGSVSAFALDPASGKLTLLNRQLSKGSGPCHIVLDRAGRHALVANYSGGSVAALPVQDDGRLGEATGFQQHTGSSVNPQRQKEPHAHSINLDAANRFAVAADLGLDKLLVYRFDPEKGTLTPNDPPFAAVAPGSGPRHFAFHPDGKRAYVINEIRCTVTAFAYDGEKGVLKELQTVSTLPGPVQDGYSTAEVQVHPSGKFLYGSNRGHHSIASFALDTAGKLTPTGHTPTGGQTPRNFGIDPTGTYLLAANQDSGTVVVFRIDAKSGTLSPTGHTAAVPMPVCVKMLPVSP